MSDYRTSQDKAVPLATGKITKPAPEAILGKSEKSNLFGGASKTSHGNTGYAFNPRSVQTEQATGEHQNTPNDVVCSASVDPQDEDFPDFLKAEYTGTPRTPQLDADRAGISLRQRVSASEGASPEQMSASEGVPGVRGTGLIQKRNQNKILGGEGVGTREENCNLPGVPGSGHITFGPFHSDPEGLFHVVESKGENPAAVKISGPIRVVALSRQIDGTGWGLVIEVPNYDGEWREIVVPREMLAGNGDSLRALLMSMGFHVATQKRSRDALMAYLEQVFSFVRTRLTSVATVGWHNGEYVTSGRIYSPRLNSDLVLSTPSTAVRMLEVSGTLDEWRENVGRFAVGNSRLLLVLGAAFAAPLLKPLGVQGGGVHLRGGSSTGKTTLLRAATSVYSQQNYQMTWRMTDNGLEGIAAARNDGLLILDEIGQVAAHKVGEAVYMLSNGEGKTRSGKEGLTRLPSKFRIMLLSTGEISLADKIGEDRFSRTRVMAGQEVRLLDLPADTGRHGAFEELHGFEDGASLATHLNRTVLSTLVRVMQ